MRKEQIKTEKKKKKKKKRKVKGPKPGLVEVGKRKEGCGE
jgi:hypothetical protein